MIEKDGPVRRARKHLAMLLLTVGSRNNEGFPSLAKRDDCDNVTWNNTILWPVYHLLWPQMSLLICMNVKLLQKASTCVLFSNLKLNSVKIYFKIFHGKVFVINEKISHLIVVQQHNKFVSVLFDRKG